MNYTWLFLDADDTLFDYSKAENGALEGTFRDFQLPCPPEVLAAYQKYNQQVWHELEQGQISALELRVARFTRLFAHLGLQIDAEAFSRGYLVHLAEGYYLIEGAAELVRNLAARYRLGLITNGLPEVQRPRLSGAGLAPYFSFVTISEEIGLAKPDPRFFEAALAQAGRPDPRSVLVIGDSLSSDIRGGVQSGLDTLWYNPAGKPADPRWPATYQAANLSTIARLLL
jgi:2-haloacid dehalogenase